MIDGPEAPSGLVDQQPELFPSRMRLSAARSGWLAKILDDQGFGRRSALRSGRPPGRRARGRRAHKGPSTGCGSSSASAAPSMPRPQRVWPTIFRSSQSTSPVPSGSRSGFGRLTCWNGLWRKCGGAPRRSDASRGETSCGTMPLGGHGPRHRRQSWPRTDAARSSCDRRPRRGPGGPTDGVADRVTYPCHGACAVVAFQQLQAAAH